MLRTIEAVIESNGSVRLLEPLSLPEARRALVTVLDEAAAQGEAASAALLSEAALADWSRCEEDAAWAHLQRERQPSPWASRAMAEHVDSSHDPHESGEDADHAAAWAEEIERRVAELRSGKVKPIPGEQVFDELEGLLR